MSKKLLKAEWDIMAEWWNSEVGDIGAWHQQNDIDPVIFKILGDIRNKKVIDIGCGNGYFARLLAKKGAIVTGIDLSGKLLSFAILKEKDRPLGIKYLLRDAANLRGIKSKSFDIAIANMSLIDIVEAKGAIKEVSRVLKKGGRFVFSITHPVFRDFWQRWVIIQEKGKEYFARAISKYLSSATGEGVLWANKVKTANYHRSIETYFGFLKNADLLVRDFKEIVTKRLFTKAKKEDGDARFRLSKYKTLKEKKMKEFARKEIPLFLIIESVKFK